MTSPLRYDLAANELVDLKTGTRTPAPSGIAELPRLGGLHSTLLALLLSATRIAKRYQDPATQTIYYAFVPGSCHR